MSNEEDNMGKVIDNMFNEDTMKKVEDNMFKIYDGICDNVVVALMPMKLLGLGKDEMAKLCAIAAMKVIKMDPDKWVKELEEKENAK